MLGLEPSWLEQLKPEFEKPYMRKLNSFLQAEITAGKPIAPSPQGYFAALNSTPLDQVKVVIIGQDPYHGPGQAHGLCFSVPNHLPRPPSLQNICKEIAADLQVEVPQIGNLQSWAQQGVLLLNATLTVELGRAGSHQNRGWEEFTDRVIDLVNHQTANTVFLLWGSFAQKKAQRVDTDRHLVLTAPHPSPLSAHRGFFGCRHFSKTNSYLMAHGRQPIAWENL